MAQLRVKQDGQERRVSFAPGALLAEVLRSGGWEIGSPCGGRGVCGKCRVTLTGQVSEPNQAERSWGGRLACQARLLGDAEVVLPSGRPMEQIETAAGFAGGPLLPPEGRYGAAVDIGTTTVALQLYRLETGTLLAEASALNPHTSVAADVMGRIGAAMEGKGELLREQIRRELRRLLEQAADRGGVPVREVTQLVVTGNTTMLYLLTGRNPECLSHAPFLADTLFGTELSQGDRHVYLPMCMNAFVGADITCAVLASGLCTRQETALLCDIGTNGELALWKDGTLYVTSTAAGPAFEGAGISCGCGSVRGAIDRVWAENGAIRIHTIAGESAVGLCGSGLLDAVAAGLRLELMDETGFLKAGCLPLTRTVVLRQRDIRAVQLAKAAIAAGIQTLLETAGTGVEEIGRVYIAGGFGSHLNPRSAGDIGMIPAALVPRVRVIGNAALAGAVDMLLNLDRRKEGRDIAARSRHVSLGGNPRFNEHYMDQMLFEA